MQTQLVATPPLTFQLDSGVLTITDPCYVDDVRILETGTITRSAKPGLWQARTLFCDRHGFGGRNWVLEAWHDAYSLHDAYSFASLAWAGRWQRLYGAIPVDAGMAGLFDAKRLPVGEKEQGEIHYAQTGGGPLSPMSA